MPLVSVFTTSYNKGMIALDAVASVLNQDFTDFEYWILENSDDRQTRQLLAPLVGSDSRIRYEEIDFTEQERVSFYPAAHLLNRYYQKANGEYIFFLADDDVFWPPCFGECVQLMEAHPQAWVVFFTMHIARLGPGGEAVFQREIRALTDVGRGTFMPSVDCRIDGGQVAHRRACLDEIPLPWYPEDHHPNQARHCDGLWLEQLARRWRFHAIDKPLMTKRLTGLSLWDRA